MAQFMGAVVEPRHGADRSGNMIPDPARTLAGCIVECWWMQVAMDADASGLIFPH
jgi:hypothetical protein